MLKYKDGTGQPPQIAADRCTDARGDKARLLGRAGDHEQRPRVDLRVAEPGQAVHGARPRHGQQHARHARQEPRRRRRVARRLLIAEADEADARRLNAFDTGQRGQSSALVSCAIRHRRQKGVKSVKLERFTAMLLTTARVTGPP